MQYDGTTAHCEAFIEDSQLSHKPSSQSEYFTLRTYGVLWDEFIIEPIIFQLIVCT
jgi:hypothetical protein